MTARRRLAPITLAAVTLAAVTLAASVVGSPARAAALPAAPTNVAATVGNLVTWTDASTDEAGFVVERLLGTTWGAVGSVGPDVTSFTDPAARSGLTYRVRAWNASGSSVSGTATAVYFSAGGGGQTVTVTPVSSSGSAPLTVTLSAVAQYDSTYTWYFGDGTSATGATVTHTFAGTPAWVDPSATYLATVRAVGPAIDFSNFIGIAAVPVTVTALPLALAPTGLTATSPTRATVRLAWTNRASQATELRVQRCTGRSCTPATVATLAAGTTTFTDSGLRSGTTYTYRVVAVHGPSGTTAAGSTVSVKAR